MGYDAGKRVKGRKRHIIVDTLGNLLGVVVHAANIQALRQACPKLAERLRRNGARLLMGSLRPKTRDAVQRIWADGAYAGRLVDGCGTSWVPSWRWFPVSGSKRGFRYCPDGGWWSAPRDGSTATGG